MSTTKREEPSTEDPTHTSAVKRPSVLMGAALAKNRRSLGCLCLHINTPRLCGDDSESRYASLKQRLEALEPSQATGGLRVLEKVKKFDRMALIGGLAAVLLGVIGMTISLLERPDQVMMALPGSLILLMMLGTSIYWQRFSAAMAWEQSRDDSPEESQELCETIERKDSLKIIKESWPMLLAATPMLIADLSGDLNTSASLLLLSMISFGGHSYYAQMGRRAILRMCGISQAELRPASAGW